MYFLKIYGKTMLIIVRIEQINMLHKSSNKGTISKARSKTIMQLMPC